jgi:hypothetical protein
MTLASRMMGGQRCLRFAKEPVRSGLFQAVDIDFALWIGRRGQVMAG